MKYLVYLPKILSGASGTHFCALCQGPRPTLRWQRAWDLIGSRFEPQPTAAEAYRF